MEETLVDAIYGNNDKRSKGKRATGSPMCFLYYRMSRTEEYRPFYRLWAAISSDYVKTLQRPLTESRKYAHVR